MELNQNKGGYSVKRGSQGQRKRKLMEAYLRLSGWTTMPIPPAPQVLQQGKKWLAAKTLIAKLAKVST